MILLRTIPRETEPPRYCAVLIPSGLGGQFLGTRSGAFDGANTSLLPAIPCNRYVGLICSTVLGIRGITITGLSPTLSALCPL